MVEVMIACPGEVPGIGIAFARDLEASAPVPDHSQTSGIALVAKPTINCYVAFDDLSRVVRGTVINCYEATVGKGLCQ